MKALSESDQRHQRHKDNDGFRDIPFGMALSVESQIKVLAVHEYADNSRNILNEIHENLSFIECNPDGPINLQKASEKLGKFCIEADSWGFSSLYEVAQGLQLFLLDSGGRIMNKSFQETIDRGLAMLSALLECCEPDFRRRLAIADILKSLNPAIEADEFNDLKNPR
jgi:hypothetical protein